MRRYQRLHIVKNVKKSMQQSGMDAPARTAEVERRICLLEMNAVLRNSKYMRHKVLDNTYE